jgi:hypothetical protein
VYGEEKRFAHVVLFECPWCLRLLSSAFLCFDEQLTDQPELDNRFTVMCTCGWVGNALDVPLASHTVQAWIAAIPSSTPDMPATEEIAVNRDWIFLVAKKIGSLSGQKSENTPEGMLDSAKT